AAPKLMRATNKLVPKGGHARRYLALLRRLSWGSLRSVAPSERNGPWGLGPGLGPSEKRTTILVSRRSENWIGNLPHASAAGLGFVGRLAIPQDKAGIWPSGILIGRDVSSGADRAGFGGIIGVASGCQRSARVGGSLGF
ncbi:hypothetical protein E4U17_004239, partial [Claviceps sp. LM77 group G4]